ncbi:unnamed protein product [Blepharisma stoltei]|uniref:DUF295 domain-containing protein n=1 Tax=Blepharisma stoltei TaxID=1481888 RepID=A0AAU9K9T5_9CILI|nr:unnamed protein product [Blepharisma stoltei]
MEYQNKIIIVDVCSNGVLIYDILKNNYSDVNSFYIKQNCYKLILKGNGRLFLIEFGLNIYESRPRDPCFWKIIGTNTLPNCCIDSSICQYKGSIYFLVNSQLWKFNIKPKNIEIADEDPFKTTDSFQMR